MEMIQIYYFLMVHWLFNNIGRVEVNLMRIDNYTLPEGEVKPYILLFEFTNEEYERALQRVRSAK